MKIGRFTKTPAERKRYEISYLDWLETGETVVGVTFGVTPATALTLAIDSFALGTPDTSVVFYAALGDSGTTYTLDVTATTSGGQIKEDQILFTVKDL